MAVLVLSSVGIGVMPRLGWLPAMSAGAFLIHVVGVQLLARGVLWAAEPNSEEEAGHLVFSLFAVFWGLIPAVVGGMWCIMYWRPHVSGRLSRLAGALEL